MTPLAIAQVIAIVVNLIVEKGIPATINVMNAWAVQNPTLNDINALKTIVRRPESYFDDGPENAPLKPPEEPLPEGEPPTE
jgi:hypothetical protein